MINQDRAAARDEDRTEVKASAADANHPNASTPGLAPDGRLAPQRSLPLWAGAGVAGALILGAVLYLAL